ncbi:FAD-dependent oxidoreductase [Mesorhizobium sp. MSK_1335]|uniref:FAD-dependent oxidoreductase n=1 Tax=Mesorhizobium montanum TaxID=3072323 RepID=A0ABU4ZT32_9HYPH|nr:FAD-dependent oxidoreductase [Mesorhizobium sp. MSK_1335]MDX8528558.1 FAD-dependent oxidoreductase [Mesorhizobium sp. MSK_1335]
MADSGMVIVGAGQSGVAAAFELRNAGWQGSITLIGDEVHLPYERPPLSKELLADNFQPVFLFTGPDFVRANITLVRNHVARILPDEHLIALKTGGSVGYSKLLLALGAEPRTLPVPLAGKARVFTLRTFDDALRLREALAGARKIIVLGGGFIGLEIAATAASNGKDVTILEAGARILTRGVPEQVAALIVDRHIKEGVQIICGVRVTQIQHNEGQTLAQTEGDGPFGADLVIAGIGAIPNVALAEAAGLRIDNGIVVNERLQTSKGDIFAAGDCCSFPHSLFENQRFRLEAWNNARLQGEVAAKNMMGAAITYSAVPWFWSDQFDCSLQIAGIPTMAAREVQRATQNAYMSFHLNRENRLIGACGFGSLGSIAKDIRVSDILIGRRMRVEPSSLSDPSFQLKSLL